MELVVADANIFIDLEHIDHLPTFFALNYKVKTPVQVFQELNPNLVKKLKLYDLDYFQAPKKVLEARDLLKFSSSFSYVDTISLTVAYTENISLLSGENLIKEWGQSNKIEVFEIMDVMDDILHSGLSSSEEMICSLKRLQKFNFWLSVNKCDQYIEKWKLV